MLFAAGAEGAAVRPESYAANEPQVPRLRFAPLGMTVMGGVGSSTCAWGAFCYRHLE
jgi:hypothetical protein